jgi:hypothetical protein
VRYDIYISIYIYDIRRQRVKDPQALEYLDLRDWIPHYYLVVMPCFIPSKDSKVLTISLQYLQDMSLWEQVTHPSNLSS